MSQLLHDLSVQSSYLAKPAVKVYFLTIFCEKINWTYKLNKLKKTVVANSKKF